MLTKFILSLLLSGMPFSAMTPKGIEVINVSGREYAPQAVDASFENGTPGLSTYLLFKGLVDPSFGGYVNVESRTKVVIISPPECPSDTTFRYAVFHDKSGVIPDVGYTVIINSALSDDLVSFYPALQEAFSKEADLIRGVSLPTPVTLCDSTVIR